MSKICIKTKIKNLLDLSFSDNKYEANSALQKALELMNNHNLTRDEIYKKNIICKEFSTEFYKLPLWIKELYSEISKVSGCYMVWNPGSKYYNLKSKIKVFGQNKDVENTIFLSEYFKTQIIFFTKNYKRQQKKYFKYIYRTEITNYKLGLINGIINKLILNIDLFYKERNKNAIVCINNKIKSNDAMTYVKKMIPNLKKSHSRYTESKISFRKGNNDSKNINLNAPIVHQGEIKLIN